MPEQISIRFVAQFGHMQISTIARYSRGAIGKSRMVAIKRIARRNGENGA
ncbi:MULTISPECIES: hypothetical protein [unclassified Bosea (in: a-proteobacteria)]|nr:MULTISPECIES: hypothetical protein [unclassified Bosea (in: a-proteobacteria)]